MGEKARDDEKSDARKVQKADAATAAKLKGLVETIRTTKAKGPSDFYTVCEALRVLTTDLAWRSVFPEVELDAFCKKHLGCCASWARQQALIAERIDRKTVMKIGVSRTRVVCKMKEGAQRDRALALALKGHSGLVIVDKILQRDPTVRQYLRALHAAWLLDRQGRARLIADLQAQSKQEIITHEHKREAVKGALEALAQ